jgi:hypothetical protein
MLKRRWMRVAKMFRRAGDRRETSAFRLALSALCLVVTLAALSMGPAGVVHAQQCDVGYGVCSGDNLCYPMGSQCCNGGGACNAGYNCWRGTSAGNFCCPGGTFGTNDGYCTPNGFQYCGAGHYCVVGYCCSGGCCTQK